MSTEDLLLRLQRDLTPPPGAQDRIRTRLQARMEAPQALRAAKAILTPTSETKRVIWERISSSLLAHRAHGFLVELRGWFSVPQGLRALLWQRFSPELQPVQQSRHLFWGVKWVATAVLLVFVVQMSPQFFWAPHSAAESETMLLPHGSVSILVDEVWQPVTEEVTLRAGMRIQTGEDGQASIVMGDDGVVRLDHETMIDLVDLSDRMEPASELVPTLSLFAGRLWLQGLVPANLRGLTVFTPVGLVTVNGGSASIGGDKEMRVEVYDRSAVITRGGRN
ncbi:MAG: FecR domain-containing protein, partial [Candidatus Peregrinibacteria bacterium]